MNLASALSTQELLDPEGRKVRLGNYWKDNPVVLVFVRHFG